MPTLTSLAFARDQLAAIDAEQRRIATELDQAEAAGRAAYDREDQAGVRAAWDRRNALAARRDALAADAARVRAEAEDWLRPRAAGWARETGAMVAGWQAEHNAAVARIDAALGVIDTALDALLLAAPAARREQAADRLGALRALRDAAEGFPYPWPEAAFPEPALDAGPLRRRLIAAAERLAGLARVQAAEPVWRAAGFVENPAAVLEQWARR